MLKYAREHIEIMSEIIPMAVSGVIGALSGTIGAYVIAKHMTNTDNLLDKIDEISDGVLTDAQLQQKLYTIGVILGKGIMDGTGIQKTLQPRGKGGGIIQQIISSIVGKYIPQLTGEPQESQEQQTVNPKFR